MTITFSLKSYIDRLNIRSERFRKSEGNIIPINLSRPPYEATLEISGLSYHLLFGRHINGWFICIPNWKIGAELAHPSDFFWNRESILRTGSRKDDALYIAAALSELSNYIT